MSSLQSLPNEVFESIVTLLDLCDIQNLRLVSREVCIKSSQDHTKSFFFTKQVDLTREVLEEFVQVTESGRLGCHIRSLTLVGVVYNTNYLTPQVADENNFETDSEDDFGPRPMGPSKAEGDLRVLEQHETASNRFHESGDDVQLLTRAFRNIAQYGSEGNLSSIILEMVVFRKDSKVRSKPMHYSRVEVDLVLEGAAKVFHTAIMALAANAQLLIRRFDVFNSVNCCSPW